MSEPTTTHGRLKVFLGMCPGVGKTYAMLAAAIDLRAKDRDVVAGIVETHGRNETAVLLEKIELLPPAIHPYRSIRIEEFDLDALLERRPQLALIDELAHTNAPGSRHPKRWQDVAEILDAGIDVYTTINIQHLESRADTVSQITKTQVRETVPDSFLDRANEIKLIDITPSDLQQRLDEGKVYLGERAKVASKNFFRDGNLTALRQLALRYTSERVGISLRELSQQQREKPTWRTREKLLVAVGTSPHAPILIRRTRAMAAALDATWAAVAVRTDQELSAAQRDLLDQHLAFARQLGAQTSIIEAPNLVDGLLEAAREQGVSQIVIGKSPGRRWHDIFLTPPALALLQKSGDIDVIAIEPGDLPVSVEKNEAAPFPRKLKAVKVELLGLGPALSLAALLALGAYLIQPLIGAPNTALFMLCGVILAGLKLHPIPILSLGALTGLLWNFLFTIPTFSLEIASAGDLTMFVALTLSALSMGSLTSRLRRREIALSRQQRHTAHLLEITTALTASPDNEAAVGNCLKTVQDLYHLPCAVQVRSNLDHQLETPHPASNFHLDKNEQAVAQWAFDKKQAAGNGTTTLPTAEAFHLPLIGRAYAMGVLSVAPGKRGLSVPERELLGAIAAQLGLALERDHLLGAIHHAEMVELDNQLRRSLLDHVSHELRTPVAVLGAAIDTLKTENVALAGQSVLQEMRSAQQRLRRVIDQLIQSARIEAGAVRANPEWWDLADLCETARERCGNLNHHPLEIVIPPDTPPLFFLDGELLLGAIENLLSNAIRHTPNGTKTHLRASLKKPASLEIIVRDEGSGFPEPLNIFERFQRGENATPGGLGLGLSIVRGLIRGLGGEVSARNHPVGGAEFRLTLPVKTASKLPA